MEVMEFISIVCGWALLVMLFIAYRRFKRVKQSRAHLTDEHFVESFPEGDQRKAAQELDKYLRDVLHVSIPLHPKDPLTLFRLDSRDVDRICYELFERKGRAVPTREQRSEFKTLEDVVNAMAPAGEVTENRQV